MNTLTLNQKTFHLEADVCKFLSDYVERIQAFVAKNQIDPDLHQDILQRLSDKLAEKENKKGWITQKIAIHIVNDLWEPEEIFADDDFLSVEADDLQTKAPKTNSSLPFYLKLQHTQRNRPQKEAILLGVCKMFEQGTGWNVRFWRGATLFASYIFLWGMMGILFFRGVVAYLLLALIFPIKEKNYEGKSVFSYFLTQIWDLRLAISNAIKSCFWAITWILGTAIPKFLSFLAKLFGPFRKFVKTCFLIGRTGFLLITIIALIILAYYFFAGWVEHQIDLMAIFPSFTKWGVLLGIVSAFLLFLGSFGALFRKKLMHSASLIVALASGILAVSIAFISGGKVLRLLHSPSIATIQKELTIPLPSDQKPLIFSFAEIPVMEYLSFEPFIRGSGLFQEMMINYLPYEEKEIKAVYHYHLRTSDPALKAKIEESLTPPTYEISGEKLILNFKGQQLFDEIVPFVPMNVSLDLYIPQDWKFNTERASRLSNLHLPERTSKYGYAQRRIQPCSDWVRYDEKENAFFCPMEWNPSPSEKREIIEGEIREKTDELSPLEGLNTERSFTSNAKNYWYLHSVLWKGENRVIAKLSDQFFNLFIELKLEVNEKGEVKILSSELKELEQKGMMNAERMKLYQGRETLKKQGFSRKEEQESWSSEQGSVSREEFTALINQLTDQGLLATQEE